MPNSTPATKEVVFDVSPVLNRYSSSSSVSRQSEKAMKASEQIRSKSRCATFAYNVPRSSIMLTIPGLVMLIIGACLVATKDPNKDWFDDGGLLVAFVFLVVGGVWTVVAVAYWIAVWCRYKPKLLPRNLNHLPNYNNANYNNANINNRNNNTNNNNSNSNNNSNNNTSSSSTPQPDSRTTSYSDDFIDPNTPSPSPFSSSPRHLISHSQTTPQETPQEIQLSDRHQRDKDYVY